MLEVLEKLRFEFAELSAAGRLRRDLVERLGDECRPRVAFVKQDVQDDLYCCRRGASPAEIIASTLMRSGPVALFTRLKADFIIVRVESDPECQAWQEKATQLGWYDLKQLEQLRDSVPGRDYGQSMFAIACDEVDWSAFDIVISLDVSVPSRITRRYPNTMWCYYIREPKTASYSKSLAAPLPGQDAFLSQRFGMHATRSRRPHVLDFPYYLQYFGCLQDVLSANRNDAADRTGIFLEHHTPEWMTKDQISTLARIGSVDSTSLLQADNLAFAHHNQKCSRAPTDIYSALIKTKYFVAMPKVRNVWGNAAVEAIAAGNLVIGDPRSHTHHAFFSRRTSVTNFEDLSRALLYFESHPTAYHVEVQRQRNVIDYICYVRPLNELLQSLVAHREHC